MPPGNHLEALGGDRAGQRFVRINAQNRICLRLGIVMPMKSKSHIMTNSAADHLSETRLPRRSLIPIRGKCGSRSSRSRWTRGAAAADHGNGRLVERAATIIQAVPGHEVAETSAVDPFFVAARR